MTKSKGHGLRFEIIVSLAVVLAAAIGLVGVVLFKYTQKEMIALKIESGLLLAQAVEENYLKSSSVTDLGNLTKTLTRTGFEGIIILDRNGKVLAVSKEWSINEPPSRAELMHSMITRRQKIFLGGRARFFWALADPNLALAVPIYRGDVVVGIVGLHSSLKDLKASWARIRQIVILYLVLDTLVMVVFGVYLLNRRLIRPLRGMLNRINALSSGSYDPSMEATHGIGEIGQLEEAFEDMAQNLTASRRELEENLASLKKTQESLVKSEKLASVGRLAAGLAHELGNPLGAVQGFMHLLNRPDLGKEERSDFLTRSMSELERMDSIIRSLLNFARPAKMQTAPVDLKALMDNAVNLARVQKWFKNFQIEKQYENGLHCAEAEVSQLTQVLLNLMTNAGQAMQEGGRMVLSAGPVNSGEVFFTVADSGSGIDPEDLEHIFEPFFSKKEPGQGTGLGLSVSQSIIESFGGRIEVESSSGEGSKFTVFLPQSQKESS